MPTNSISPMCDAESRERRDNALASITSTAGAAYAQLDLPDQVQLDLQYAEGVIAQAVSGDSWSRNASWVKKFTQYVCTHCEALIREHGSQRVLTSDTIATAFLANVVQENPQATTRVGSAKLSGKWPNSSSVPIRTSSKARSCDARVGSVITCCASLCRMP